MGTYWLVGDRYFDCLARLLGCDPAVLLSAGVSPEEFMFRYNLCGMDESIILKLDALREFLELMRDLRRQSHGRRVNNVNSVDAVAELAVSLYSGVEDQEEVMVLYLDRDLVLLRAECVSRGSASRAFIPVDVILRNALSIRAGFLILVHNHVKQFLKFSDEDKCLTVKLWDACRIVGIELLDHVLVGICGHVSYREEVGF